MLQLKQVFGRRKAHRFFGEACLRATHRQADVVRGASNLNDVVRAVGLWHDTLIVPEPGPVSSRAVGPFGAIQLSTTQVAEPRLFLGSSFRLNIRPSGAI